MKQAYAHALALLATMTLAAPAAAQGWTWQPWTFTGALSGQVDIVDRGSMALQVVGDGTSGGGHVIEWAQGPQAGQQAAAYGAGFGGGDGPWGIRLDFSGLASTQGLVLAVGNFGHGSAQYPGYSWAAWDRAGQPLSAAAFVVLGSLDHRWVSPDYPLRFNDDVVFVDGGFEVEAVPGEAEFDSDLLLLALPAQLSRLEITSLGASGGDTVNVLLANPVPEPGAWALWLAGLAGLGRVVRLRRASQR